MLTEKEKNILDKIFYNDNGYIFGLNSCVISWFL